MEETNRKSTYQRAMVIDDNEVDRYIAKRILSHYHFADEVILKESAKKALEYLKSMEQTPQTVA